MTRARTFLAFVLLPLSLAPASCAKKASTEGGEVKNPDTYTWLSISDVDSLDPAWSYDTASHEAILQIYEPLVFYKGESLDEFEPMIATEVPSPANGGISKDGRTYRFKIRQGVKFHDGTPLVPQDVRYSLMRFCLQDRDGGPSSLLLEPITGVAATREKDKVLPKVYKLLDQAIQVKGDEVAVTLKAPFAPFLSILASWAPVVSQKWMSERGAWDGTEATWVRHNNPKKEDSPIHDQANGTGAFKLERWSKETKDVVFVRNDDYWREPAKLKRAILKGVDEFATRKLMLSAGDADSIYADRVVYPDVKDIPGVTLVDDLPTVDMNPTVFFTFDIETTANPDIGSGKLDGQGIPPDFFKDVEIRRAFAHSMEYEAYIRDVARGKGTQARGCIPKTLLGYDASLPVHAFDLKKAEEHFKKAWKGQAWEKGFRLTATYNSGNVPRQVMMQMLQRNVESLNPKFKIDVRGVQWSTYLAAFTAHKLPLFTLGWAADYPDPHNFVFPFLHSKGNWPTTQRFAEPRFDRLIEKGMAEIDPAKRKAIYGELQRLAHDLVPQLYIIDTVRFRTQRDWVQGWSFNPIFPDAPYGCYLYPLGKGKKAAAGTT